MITRPEWKDDCFGKKDYDMDILSVSSRYWPSGGSSLIYEKGNLQKYDDGTLPCAISHILISDGNGDSYPLISSGYIYGADFEEVAMKVEKWTQEQMGKAIQVLQEAFAGVSQKELELNDFEM